MAFIGNQPTAVPLTSSQLADGLITTAKLATDAVTSAKIADGAIVNVDVNSTAAVAYSKLNLATSIVNADISASAAIATTKLGAGAVLQAITATDSTQRSTTSSSFVTASNTLSVSITPSSASNKIYIVVTGSIYIDGSNGYGEATIFRGSTNLCASRGMSAVYGSASAVIGNMSMSVLDSPNTTSAITYQVRIKRDGATTVYIQEPSGTQSSITAFEIAG